MGLTLNPQSLVKAGPDNAISLGSLAKAVTDWTIGLGWDPGSTRKVDCDLWLVLLEDGQAVELVRYDEADAKKKITSPSGALEYLGDDRTGESSDGGDDEQGRVHLDKFRVTGHKVLIIANIYEPDGLTFDQIDNAYVRVFPGNDESKAQAIQLTDKGKGARTVIFGWLEVVGDDVKFENNSSHASDIAAALAPFGVS
jgi:tellurium resistance protein TerD